jgi:hypothetical protein
MRRRWLPLLLVLAAMPCCGSQLAPGPAAQPMSSSDGAATPSSPQDDAQSSSPSTASDASTSAPPAYGYFYNDGYSIYAVPKGGGTPVLALGTDPSHYYALMAFDAKDVFYTDSTLVDGDEVSTLLSVPTTLIGPPVTIASGFDNLYRDLGAVVLDRANLYASVAGWREDGGTSWTIEQLPRSGTSMTLQGGSLTIAHNAADDPIAALASSGGYVYWTVSSTSSGGAQDQPTGSVLRVPIGGGNVETLAQAQASPGAIAVDGSSTVYWLNEGKNSVDCGPSGGALMRLKPGSTSPEALVSNLDGAASLAVSDANAYWSLTVGCDEPGPGGSVAKLLSSSAETLMGNLTEPEGLYVDDTSLYFTTTDRMTMGSVGTETATFRVNPHVLPR